MERAATDGAIAMINEPYVDFDFDALDPEVEPIEPDLPRAALDYLVRRVLIDMVSSRSGRVRSSKAISVRLLAWLCVVYPKPLLAATRCRTFAQLACGLGVSRHGLRTAMFRIRRSIRHRGAG